MRIIAACRDLGLPTVIACSDADRDALPARLADELICIGPAPPNASYLDVPRILAAAEIAGADAVHPGYGFLAESSALAEVCEACRVTFIGPPPAAIRAMGDKALARKTMSEAGVPHPAGNGGAGDRRRRGARRRRRDRLPGAAQGFFRRRRAGNAHRGGPLRHGGGARRGRERGQGGLRRSRRCTWSGTWRASATSRCRCSPIRPAARRTWASATARCSAATRN